MSGINLVGFGDVIDALDYQPFGRVKYVVGTNVEYSVYVEYGTSEQRAQPYLRPALEQALREFDTYASEADSAEELVENLALRVEAIAKEEVPVDTGNLRGSIEAERVQ
jgi:hypothetical protein